MHCHNPNKAIEDSTKTIETACLQFVKSHIKRFPRLGWLDHQRPRVIEFGEVWQLSNGSPADATSCLLLNAVDIDHDVNVVDVMLTVRWFSKEDMPSQDHLVSFDLLTILSGQGHIRKVVVISQISIRSTLPLKLVKYFISSGGTKWPLRCLYWFLSIFIKQHLLQFKLLGCSQFGAHVKHFCVC